MQWTKRTLLDNRLHRLMQMIMHMLLDLRLLLRLGFSLLLVTRILQTSAISLGLGFRGAIILIDAALLGLLRMLMVLRQDFGVFEGLDCGVVDVLMSFFLDEGLFARLMLLLDMFVFDSGRDFGVDCLVYLAIVGSGRDLRINSLVYRVVGVCG